MEIIEKYDQFQDGDEIVEFTGLYRRDMAHRLPIFKIIEAAPGSWPGDVKIFEKGVFERSQYKKLPTSPNHPVVREAATLSRDKPEIRAQLAKALAIQFKASTPAEKQNIIELLREALPEELRKSLMCEKLCGQCRECAKRIWRRDNA